MRPISIICAVLSLFSIAVQGQNKVIRGKVIDENLETLSGVYLSTNNTVPVGQTDVKGFFQITVPDSVSKLSFFFLGCEKATVEFTSNCNDLEVVMLSRPTYDFISLKREDKLRLKQFRTLPELHKKAFDRGIFQFEKPCFNQEFRYIKNKKQR